ncbi:RTA1 like protein-domain-containing protein [Pestalotiopsis sp. NC0098]|nr:RTA1 like protein-domain-containing protein [Pestalotiopsis sp. NC0098]
MSNSPNSTAGYAPFDLYPYNPSQPPAYAFLGLFGLAAVVHLVLMIPYRAWFPLPMVLGCAMEAAGYYFRSVAHNNERQIGAYIIQYLMIFVAPPMIAAMIYMSPGRILRALRAEDCSIFSPRWQTKLFVLIDTVCFATQFAGAIMSGSEDANEASQGLTTILTGLIVQVAAFALFIVSLLISHARLNNRFNSLSKAPDVHWRRYYGGLYAVSGLFLVRNTVRIIEQRQGASGTIASTEAYLYASDALFMFVVVATMILLHPGRLIRNAVKASKVEHFESGLALE